MTSPAKKLDSTSPTRAVRFLFNLVFLASATFASSQLHHHAQLKWPQQLAVGDLLAGSPHGFASPSVRAACRPNPALILAFCSLLNSAVHSPLDDQPPTTINIPDDDLCLGTGGYKYPDRAADRSRLGTDHPSFVSAGARGARSGERPSIDNKAYLAVAHCSLQPVRYQLRSYCTD